MLGTNSLWLTVNFRKHGYVYELNFYTIKNFSIMTNCLYLKDSFV